MARDSRWKVNNSMLVLKMPYGSLVMMRDAQSVYSRYDLFDRRRGRDMEGRGQASLVRGKQESSAEMS